MGVILVSLLGCARPNGAVVRTETSDVAGVRASGVCTLTNGVRGGSYTYADGFLVKIDSPSDTIQLEWEGGQLVRTVQRRGVEIVSERRFQYRADGRLTNEQELEAVEPSGLEVSAYRRFSYNEEGWLVGIVEDDTERDVKRCSWAYQDGRPTSITCWHPGYTSVVTLRYDDSGRNVAAETADIVAAERPNSTDTYTYAPDGTYAEITTTDDRGRVTMSRREERDENDRLQHIVWSTPRRTVQMLGFDYEGDFPPGFTCGAPVASPPGYPSVRASHWLNLHIP